MELGFLWGVSTVRTFALVNDLLARASSNERLYAVNGGNDLMAIFLTDELWDLITAHPCLGMGCLGNDITIFYGDR